MYVKVKDLIQLFENNKDSAPESIAITCESEDKILMRCNFESWKNIDESILNTKVNSCYVLLGIYTQTLGIDIGSLS